MMLKTPTVCRSYWSKRLYFVFRKTGNEIPVMINIYGGALQLAPLTSRISERESQEIKKQYLDYEKTIYTRK